MTRHVSFYPAVLLVTLCALMLLASCGRTAGETDEADSEWTVAEDEFTLEEDLVIADNADFYFGRIFDIAVRDDGRIYVADGGEHHVKVLSPEGELLETVGREGEGPGEFQRPMHLYLSDSDSVYVMDMRRRITAFAPGSHELAYTVALDAPEGRFPASLIAAAPDGNGFIVEYVSSVRDPSTHSAVHRVRHDGQPDEDVFFVPRDSEFLTDESGDIPRSMPKPFGRSSHVAVGPDGRVYHGETDALAVEVYTHDGTPLDTLSVPYTPVPVIGEDITHIKERYDNEWASRMIDNADLDDTKPAFSTLLVDDHGQLWFKRPTDDPERADWWIADPEAERVSVVPLPSNVHLSVVRDGYAYGRTESEDGAPALARYRIQK